MIWGPKVQTDDFFQQWLHGRAEDSLNHLASSSQVQAAVLLGCLQPSYDFFEFQKI